MVRHSHPKRRLRLLQALLLAFALLATPIALLAHPSSHTKPRCNGMCCRAKKSHSAPAAPVSENTASEVCDRGAARHLSMCLLPPDAPQDRNAAAFAPLPPAILVDLTCCEASNLLSPVPVRISELCRPGFAPLPFQPPRS